MKTIAVLFAEGFEEIEAISVIDVLRRAEFNVSMVGVTASTVDGAHGVRIEMDSKLADLDVDALDAIILPGGLPGAFNLRDSDPVIAALQSVAANDKVVAAICAAPVALDAAGLLDGKTYTCYPSFDEQINSGTHVTDRVVVDGSLITSRGPGTAIEFALAVVNALGAEDTAAALQDGMLVNTNS